METSIIPYLAIGLPLLAVLAAVVYAVLLIAKPSQDVKRLEERAAAGDPAAKAALARADELRGAMNRAVSGDDPERKRLLAFGTPGRATIVDVRAAGLDVSAGPVPTRIVEVVLAIDSPTGPRQVTIRDAVNQLFLGRMLKGATVPIRIDPTNPAKIAVLWDTQ